MKIGLYYLTNCLSDIPTNILLPLLALLDEFRATLLAGPLIPDQGEEGGDIDTDLLLVLDQLVTRSVAFYIF